MRTTVLNMTAYEGWVYYNAASHQGAIKVICLQFGELSLRPYLYTVYGLVSQQSIF